MFQALHHVAIICSGYAVSKRFYTEILGLKIIREIYRKERESYKLDLEIPGGGQIELFSFPHPPARVTDPEASGLRHIAFTVRDIASAIELLKKHGIGVEPIRTDSSTNKRFTFFKDPDNLPIELYEL